MTLAHLGTTLAARLRKGQSTLLVTLVDREGHAYAEPGAHLLIDPSASETDEAVLSGYLSGGCLESEVVARSMGMSPKMDVRSFTLDLTEDGPFAIDLACGGTLHLLAEWVDPERPASEGWLAWAERIEQRGEAARWIGPQGSYAWRAADLHIDADRCPIQTPAEQLRRHVREYPDTLGPRGVRARLRPARGGWLEVVPPPPTLWVIGTERDGEAVAAVMLQQGWTLKIAAPSRRRLEDAAMRIERRAGLRPELHVADAHALARLPFDAADRVLAASHRLDLDAAALQAASEAGVRWLGAIGSSRRAERLLRDVSFADVNHPPPAVEMPAGLTPSARGPEEVAISIAARLIEDLHDASKPVWAIVPAAGKGSRMGTSKPLLHNGEETLLARVQREVEPVTEGTIVVTGHQGDRVADSITPGSLRVHHPDWRDGMASSLRTALGHLPRNARALVVLPDMPHVGVAHLAELRKVAGESSWTGAASAYADGTVGVPALLPEDLVRDALASSNVPQQGRGFSMGLEARRNVKRIALRDAKDLDTAADAKAAGWFVLAETEDRSESEINV